MICALSVGLFSSSLSTTLDFDTSSSTATAHHETYTTVNKHQTPITADETAVINFLRVPVPAPQSKPVEELPPLTTADDLTNSEPGNLTQSATTAPTEQTPTLEPAARIIHVALSGGQSVVDLGQGPVLFPLAGWPPYVAEHDFHGGWERIGTLNYGMNVTLSGLVSGDYTVGEILNVPRGGTTADLTFTTTPKVMLQTCIPGTTRMMVVGLY